jgi:hypothetical protein
MLDPRVRQAITEYQAGHCTLEVAAQRLLRVRRESGCLDLRASPAATTEQRALITRYSELVAEEFGHAT